MKRITAIFSFIILLTLGSFAILWAVSPDEEKDRVMATQGIRLVGSAVFYNAENSTTPNRIKVGDLLIGSNEQVFRINEIRKSQSNTIYVVVSWKYITDYTTCHQASPYRHLRLVLSLRLRGKRIRRRCKLTYAPVTPGHNLTG